MILENRKTINGFNLNMQADSIHLNIIPGSLITLSFIAADLPQEVAVPVDELEGLRKLCDELRSQIIQSGDDIPKSLKTWLLDLVRLMLEGIDRYRIRGRQGLRRQFHEMLGSVGFGPEVRNSFGPAGTT